MLHFVDMTSSKPAVTHVIPRGYNVGGVTSLGNDVFVVRRSSRNIEVYDAMIFTLRRSNKCLYASEWDNNSVHRVELTGSNAVMNWSVAGCPVGLTVNRAQNLLVVSSGEGKLQEFTTHGTLLQNVQLQLHNGRSWHAIDLASGQFVASLRGRMHGVCLMDDKGTVIASHGVQGGSKLTDMYNPSHLAVDKHGNILVANESSNRLLVIDRSLSSVHEMSVSVDGGLNGPFALWYDKSRDRLFIGEFKGCRVIVIDHLKDFTTSHV